MVRCRAATWIATANMMVVACGQASSESSAPPPEPAPVRSSVGAAGSSAGQDAPRTELADAGTGSMSPDAPRGAVVSERELEQEARKARIIGVLRASDGSVARLQHADGGAGFGGLGLRLRRVDGGVGFGGLGLGATVDGRGGLLRATSAAADGGTVRGSLSKDVIRRVIRRHINEIRYCYEKQLRQHPGLQGQVRVRFVIGPSGSVESASISRSELNSTGVERCITERVQKWRFPQPSGGGIVVVTYPFGLEVSGSSGGADAG